MRSLELWLGLLSFKLIDAGRCLAEVWSVEPEFERLGRGVSIGLQWFVAVSVCVELLYNSRSYLDKYHPYIFCGRAGIKIKRKTFFLYRIFEGDASIYICSI